MKSLMKFLKTKNIFFAILIAMFFLTSVMIEVIISYIIQKRVDMNSVEGVFGFQKYVPVLIFLTVVYGVFKYVASKLSVSYAGGIVKECRLHKVSSMQQSKIQEIRSYEVGELYTFIHENIASLEETLKLFPATLAAPFMLAITLLVFFWFNWKVTLICMITIPIPSFLFNTVNRPIQKMTAENIENTGKANDTLKSTIQGLDIIKTNRIFYVFANKYSNQLDTILRKDMDIEKAKAKTIPFTFFLRVFPQIMIPMYISYLAYKGECSIGLLPAFGLLVGNIFNPINTILRFNMKSKESNAIIQNLDKLDKLSLERMGGEIPKVEKKVIAEFDHVFFQYKDKPVLEDISLQIDSNQLVSIVGESGSGKSTLIKLLEGLYDTYQGNIRIFGNDLKTVDLEKMRQQVAVMSQNAFLLSASIKENLLYGVKNCTEEDIRNACKMANLEEVIRKLPNGENTLLTERGMNLSGGQRQRIALARAILRDAPMIILDEATSGLDPMSVQCILHSVHELKKNHTVVMITHDIKMASESDVIILLKDHKVRGVGNHEALLKDEYYQRLYDAQKNMSE